MIGFMIYSTLRDVILNERPDIDIEAVGRAYEFANQYHKGQTRYSGEPYLIHPVAATHILLRLNPDLAAIQACLLHDVTEDTEATYEDIKKSFGEEVADLVKGSEKMALVKVKGSGSQEDQWKNMFLAMAKDVRIVFIKLSDRLHNMQTLQHVPEEKQYRIAHESLVVHAAIASRLGIYQIKSELEDLCFKYLYPDEYEELAEQVAAYQGRSEECMSFAISQVEQLMVREGIKIEKVSGRLKHLWSIYQKLKKKDVSDLSGIYDLFAVRLILPDVIREDEEQVSHLYSTLGILHNVFIPLQDRFKDYVAVPKPNGYRSLHTTIVGLGGDIYEEPTEVQIRSLSMHREAELGIASHWSYKASSGLSPTVSRKRHFALHTALAKVHALVDEYPEIEGSVRQWVEHYQDMMPEDRSNAENILREKGIEDGDFKSIRQGRSQESLVFSPNVDKQLAWLRGLAEASEAISELDLYPDRIFVLTPNRDVKSLPRGSTPIDFAYLIHTEVGNKIVHAKVNGRIVPLDYELRNGDLVEVGTRKNAQPNRYWLSIAQTSSARAKIKNWFNKQDKDTNIAAGRDMLNHQLRLINQPELDEKLSILKEYAGKKRNISEREQILEGIGLGSTAVSHVLKMLFPNETVQEKKKETPAQSIDHASLMRKVLITGEEDLPVVLSACCKPRPPHVIIGYVTRGRSIRVHRQSCQELTGLEGQRFVSAHWKA